MIVVRDGLEPSVSVIARYCGDVDDAAATSSGDTVLVEFDSDGRHQGPGFAARYSFTERRQPETATPPANDERQERQPTKQPNDAGKYQRPATRLNILGRCSI